MRTIVFHFCMHLRSRNQWQHTLHLFGCLLEASKWPTIDNAARGPIQASFPSVQLNGCWFHYLKAVFKKIKRLGLLESLKSDQNIKRAVQKVYSLPLLPNESISEGLSVIDGELKKTAGNAIFENWNQFIAYMAKQWLPAKISVYGLERRTNNFTEPFNKFVNDAEKIKRPSIWHTIHKLIIINDEKSLQLF